MVVRRGSGDVPVSVVELKAVIAALGYERSENYLSGDGLESDADNSHIFRKARENCGLDGVYVLSGSKYEKAQANVPIVYVCQATSEEEGQKIHRLVWNQNVVPFVLVISPKTLRVYPGFRYEPRNEKTQEA